MCESVLWEIWIYQKQNNKYSMYVLYVQKQFACIPQVWFLIALFLIVIIKKKILLRSA